MAKRKPSGRAGRTKRAGPKTAGRRRVGAAARPRRSTRAVRTAKTRSARKKAPRKNAAKAVGSKRAAAKPSARRARAERKAVPPPSRLDRPRRILKEETIYTPPSSLDMDRHGSAVRTGRAELAEVRENLGAMGALTSNDPDADAETAYFSGDEAPGGDNPTPDQDIVDDIGRALGVSYQDTEELRSSDKLIERDKHRWELDPASAEDYKEHK
jgi:Family of unknown function (DUF6335)